jgi:hypothetical protein
MAGYSGTPLVQKLGLQEGHKFLIMNSPPKYKTTLGKIPAGAVMSRSLQRPLDFVQFFTKEKTELESRFPEIKNAMAANGMIWISWPKGASGVKTDLNEGVVRQIGLQNGWVDVKVCAVDEVWSGLKFVIRLKDRPK